VRTGRSHGHEQSGEHAGVAWELKVNDSGTVGEAEVEGRHLRADRVVGDVFLVDVAVARVPNSCYM
jgi:hypothetical protein